MNNERRRDWTVEALVTKAFLASTDEGQKSTREFRIQNDKLLRMLQKETRSTHQIAREILLGGPTKQEKKRRGKAHARIGEQRKKVRALLMEFVRENLRAHSDKPITRKQMQFVMRVLDASISKRVHQLIADTARTLGKPLPSPKPRPFGRIGS